MTLSRWSPMREFDRLFVDFFGTPLVDDSREPRTWYLPLDVVDRGNAYEVKAALPGFKAEDVELTFAVLVVLTLIGIFALRAGWRASWLLAVGVAMWLLVMLVLMPITGAGRRQGGGHQGRLRQRDADDRDPQGPRPAAGQDPGDRIL